jgi:hypothetical protein
LRLNFGLNQASDPQSTCSRLTSLELMNLPVILSSLYGSTVLADLAYGGQGDLVDGPNGNLSSTCETEALKRAKRSPLPAASQRQAAQQMITKSSNPATLFRQLAKDWRLGKIGAESRMCVALVQRRMSTRRTSA